MLTSSVNYKDSYFEQPPLTAIRWEPTYETLHNLKNELKANANSVRTTLGGGNHGYLGMILTPAEYHRIAPTDPSTRPPNTGVLIQNLAGTAAQIASAEDTHWLTKKLYLVTLLLKQTFIHKSSRPFTPNILPPFATPSLEKLCHSFWPSLSSCTTTIDASPRNNLTTRQPPSSQLSTIHTNQLTSSSTPSMTWLNTQERPKQN